MVIFKIQIKVCTNAQQKSNKSNQLYDLIQNEY